MIGQEEDVCTTQLRRLGPESFNTSPMEDAHLVIRGLRTKFKSLDIYHCRFLIILKRNCKPGEKGYFSYNLQIFIYFSINF